MATITEWMTVTLFTASHRGRKHHAKEEQSILHLFLRPGNCNCIRSLYEYSERDDVIT